jgi:hypothetical protein
VRIGTWNLEGRWSDRHRDLLTTMDCDVLLLTEVPKCFELAGFGVHRGERSMAAGRRWAAVASRLPMRPQSDPHGASAMVVVDGLRTCSSVLPWRSCGSGEPWAGGSTAERTAAAVAAVEVAGPSIWGGDWNHALAGREWAGSMAGRRHVLAAVERLSLQVPTASSPHRIEGLVSIDHIAVPDSWVVRGVSRHGAAAGNGGRLSDHDAYVVEVDRSPSTDATDPSKSNTSSSRIGA